MYAYTHKYMHTLIVLYADNRFLDEFNSPVVLVNHSL